MSNASRTLRELAKNVHRRVSRLHSPRFRIDGQDRVSAWAKPSASEFVLLSATWPLGVGHPGVLEDFANRFGYGHIIPVVVSFVVPNMQDVSICRVVTQKCANTS